MSISLQRYETIVGRPVIQQLRRLAEKMAGIRILNVNSTKEGGGVAEILEWMVPLMNDMGVNASWEAIRGTPDFFNITKAIHNGLQGFPAQISEKQWDIYQEVNRSNFENLSDALENSDVVVIHDPQPAALLDMCANRKGKWIWRAHIDISHPFQPVWRKLKTFVKNYDASIFSMAQFAQALPLPQYIVAPSIDPLSEKNIDLDKSYLDSIRSQYSLDPDRPLLVQVSRFDRFKDPLGVIQAYRYIRKAIPVQLVLAGGGATDDPEGKEVLEEVMLQADNDPDIHVLLLPADSHRIINALQRLADIIIQKSTKEGFGLTVTEGLWKGKPVIGGDVGGIRIQVINHHTGYLVNTPEGAAHRIRFLLHRRQKMQEMGKTGREFVRENFLLTRHLRDYLTLFYTLINGNGEKKIQI